MQQPDDVVHEIPSDTDLPEHTEAVVNVNNNMQLNSTNAAFNRSVSHHRVAHVATASRSPMAIGFSAASGSGTPRQQGPLSLSNTEPAYWYVYSDLYSVGVRVLYTNNKCFCYTFKIFLIAYIHVCN